MLISDGAYNHVEFLCVCVGCVGVGCSALGALLGLLLFWFLRRSQTLEALHINYFRDLRKSLIEENLLSNFHAGKTEILYRAALQCAFPEVLELYTN